MKKNLILFKNLFNSFKNVFIKILKTSFYGVKNIVFTLTKKLIKRLYYKSSASEDKEQSGKSILSFSKFKANLTTYLTLLSKYFFMFLLLIFIRNCDFVRYSSFTVSIENFAMDKVINFERFVYKSIEDNTQNTIFKTIFSTLQNRYQKIIEQNPISYVLISYEDYEKWKREIFQSYLEERKIGKSEPYKNYKELLDLNLPLTPRDKILQLIEFSLKNNAKVVIVDFLFDRKSFRNIKDKRGNIVDEDKYFKEGLKELLKKKYKNKNTKIIFLYHKDLETGEYKLPPFFKELKDDKDLKNKIFAGLPAVFSDKSDGLTRFIKFFDIRLNNGKYRVLWNVSLLALVLYNNDYGKLKNLEKKIIKTKISGENSLKNFDEWLKLKDGSTVHIKSDFMVNRIVFIQSPNPATYDRYKYIYTVSKIERIKKPSNLFKDKIVIIGSANRNNGDVHLTPVGSMSGVFVIGNSILTLKFLQIEPILSLNFLVITLIIFTFYISIKFIELDDILIRVMLTLFFLVLTAVSVIIFDNKVLDFAIIIATVVIFKTLTDILKLIEKFTKKISWIKGKLTTFQERLLKQLYRLFTRERG